MNECAKKIFEIQVSTRAKILYLCLCSCANKKGQASVSYNVLLKKLNLSSKTLLSNAIKELTQSGLITKDNRLHKDGGIGVNLYTIHNWSE